MPSPHTSSTLLLRHRPFRSCLIWRRHGWGAVITVHVRTFMLQEESAWWPTFWGPLAAANISLPGNPCGAVGVAIPGGLAGGTS